MNLHLLQKKNKWFLITIMSVILGLIFAFFYFKKSEVLIPTVTVNRGSIAEQSEAVGNIKTCYYSTIKSQVDGIVEAIYHEEGEYITKDTPLIKIKPVPTPIAYAEAYKNLVHDKTEEQHAEVVFKRQQQLLNAKIIRANNEGYMAAQKEYNLAKNQRILSEQKLALLTGGETLVGNKTVANVVNSPIDGYILSRNVNVGDPVISISASQAATALFMVANMKELIFLGSVDERDAAKIKIGMLAKIKVGSLPDQEILGTINRIALQSDKENLAMGMGNAASTSSNSSANSPFNVGFRIEIANLQLPQGLILRSGYSATANIEIKKVDNVLMLPMRVIHFKDTKPYVLLPAKNRNKPQEQSLELGISDGINVEIKRGLQFGEKVIDQPDTTVVTQDK